MKTIIWLASYPKSGNTWFRVFLTNLLLDGGEPADINQLERTPIASGRYIFDETVGVEAVDLTHDEVERLRPDVYRHLSDQNEERRFLKIHDAYTYIEGDPLRPLIPPEATRGVIYIIRNPLDVAISFAHHSAISIDKAITRMEDESVCLSGSTHAAHSQLRQRLLSWSGHVRSWVDAPGLDVMVIKYEDMKSCPFDTFSAAVRFAGLQYTLKQVKKALAFSDIRELQRQENDRGFREKPMRSESFFRRGETGEWKTLLKKTQVKRIIKTHGDVMRRFGYLDEKGEPL